MELGKVLYNRLAMEGVDRQVKELGEARIKRWERALEAEVEAAGPKSHNPFQKGGAYGDPNHCMLSGEDFNYLVNEEQPAAQRAFWPFPMAAQYLTIPEDQA